MAASEVECFSGVQTAQNSKTEGGIKRKKKHENVKLKEDVPGAILLREKPEECKSVCSRSSTSIFFILAGYVLSLVFYKMAELGSS